MKIKGTFLLRKIDEEYMVVPVGTDLVDFGAMLSFNETGAFLWEQLQQERTLSELIEVMTTEYAVEKAVAQADIEEFLNLLKQHNLLSD